MTTREVDELVRRLDAGLCGYVPHSGDGKQPAVIYDSDGRTYHVSEILLALLDRIEALEERVNDDGDDRH